MGSKVIVIGLDGATFGVIDPLIERGYLPNMKYFRREGASQVLHSTVPAVTGPAWMAFATGKKPGRTGIIDFRNLKDPGRYKLEPISSADFAENGSLWDYVGLEGGRVCVFNYPMLSPAYEINGFMTAGVGAVINSDITFPAGLKGELEKIMGGNYTGSVPYIEDIYLENPGLFIKDLNRLLDKNIKAINYLSGRYDWDLFLSVVSGSDFLLHHMWDTWKEYVSGGFDEKIGRAADFIDIWVRIDRFIGQMRRDHPEAGMFIVSGHGFQGIKDVFYIDGSNARDSW